MPSWIWYVIYSDNSIMICIWGLFYLSILMDSLVDTSRSGTRLLLLLIPENSQILITERTHISLADPFFDTLKMVDVPRR